MPELKQFVYRLMNTRAGLCRWNRPQLTNSKYAEKDVDNSIRSLKRVLNMIEKRVEDVVGC